MIRRAMFGLIASCLFVLPAMALDRMLTPEEEDMIKQINAHNTAIHTMAGRFVQIDTMGNRAEGMFFLERPNKISFRYAPPSRQQIVSVGKGFFLIDKAEKKVSTYPQDAIPLRQFLKKDINLFEANILDVVMDDTHVSVTITDDTPAGTVQVDLIFDKETKDLVQWTLTEPSGAELTFSIYDVAFNIELPDSLFFINRFFDS